MRSFIAHSFVHLISTRAANVTATRRRSVLALAAVILAVVALSSAGDCPISVSVSRIDTTSIRVIADGGGGCGASTIRVYVKDPKGMERQIAIKQCVDDGSCYGQPLHLEQIVGTTCWLSGAHTFRAVSECYERTGTGWCTIGVNGQTGGGSVTVDSKPRLTGISFSGPDEAGNGTLSANWFFPPEAMGMDRGIGFYSRPVGATSWNPFHGYTLNSQPPSGTSTAGFGVACRPEYEFKAVVQGCYNYYGPDPPAPEFTDEASTSVPGGATPSISFGTVDSQAASPWITTSP